MSNKDKKLDIEKRLDDKQNDYFELVTGFQKDGTPVVDDYQKTKFVYKWEQMKELQKEIIHLSNYEREVCLEIARKSLEEAFTPRIKSMLSKKVQKEMEDG